MSLGGFDESILNDFLTESGELLEQLESDLVTLEHSPDDPEMLNQVFRALHTIKGSASFLGLVRLVSIAHAAEGALNAARGRVIRVDRPVMDLLLQAVDVLKVQFGQVRSGSELTAASAELLRGLTLLTEAKQGQSSTVGPRPADKPGISGAESAATVARVRPRGSSESVLTLGPGKQDLVEFLVVDLDETLARARARIEELSEGPSRARAANGLAIECGELVRAVEFFGCAGMTVLARTLHAAAEGFVSLDEASRGQLLPRLQGACMVLQDQSSALRSNIVREWPIGTLVKNIDVISRGGLTSSIPDAAGSALTALRLDGLADLCDAVSPVGRAVDAARRGAPAREDNGGSTVRGSSSEIGPEPLIPPRAGDTPAKPEGRSQAHGANAEQTIRVEVGRLETLMNLVGELVLQKNRIAALARQLGNEKHGTVSVKEAVTLAAGGLDRVTADIQVAVMRTRMQPLEKLFGKYPRLIRDLCGKTGKLIELVIEGGETEVDKSIIEELGDPLVHLLRNSVDHGIESPQERLKAGKRESGTITLRASHEGSHVQISIIDDGRGFQRDKIAAKAVERGLIKSEEVRSLNDRDIFRFIMLPGFSTAEIVSDLSGRGVGMDVVRTNIENLDGTIELSSKPGESSTVAVSIPLTVAIVPAMMVAVGEEIYAIPLTNILEIVKPQADQIGTIGGRRVMRQRNSVLPLMSAAELFGLSGTREIETPFAVVLTQSDRRVGLMVTRLIGQQEIVIKPLDGMNCEGGAASGATVRDDGGVSLIVDVSELIRMAEGQSAAA